MLIPNLRNVYRAMFVFLVLDERKRGELRRLPYWGLVLQCWIVFFVCLPLIITGLLYQLFRSVISEQDAEDSIQARQKLLAIYQQTSEYEFRHPDTIALRILKEIPKDKEGNLVSNPLSPDTIANELMFWADKLFCVRLETAEEFVRRKLMTVTVENYQLDEDTLKLQELYRERYTQIVAKAGDNELKAVYLGLDVMATKIRVGKKREPPRYQESPAV